MNPVADLVAQSAVTAGTGNFALTAVNGRQAFATAFSTGSTPNVFFYYISNQSAPEWEIGKGHMLDVSTLVRDTVIASSNANSPVNFSPGTKSVDNDLPAKYQALLVNPPGRIVTAAGPISITDADGTVQIAQTVGAAMTVNVDPSVLTPWREFTVKDAKGDAFSNNITIVPSSGTIENAGSYIMSFALQATTFYSDGTNLWVK